MRETEITKRPYNLPAPKVILLKRVAMNDSGTFGVLVDNWDIPFALTIELEWKDNKKNISCIPAGMYNCKRINSPSRGEVFEVLNVPKRTHILFHVANTEDDLKGCIGIGERFEYIGDKVAVWMSKIGYDEFMKRLQDKEEFVLVIRDFTK